MNIAEEEKYLTEVLNLIDAKIAELDKLVDITDKDMADFHEYFWNSYTEFDEYGYELYDNTNAIRQKIVQKGDYIREKYTYGRMKDSPYFGRVDFVFDDETEAQHLYIGISNLSRDEGDIPVVFDWRAPVSSLFYDYDAGRAMYSAPMGEITGDITHKYQYKISSGRIVYMLESDISIDDDILKCELGKNASAKLRAIVTTIQREQNAIIRDTSHRILAVQGCAGSGKTSIALHRIAYLLYHNRNTFKASQVLILSPNGLFADYISRILPELGEENISETSLDIWAYRKLRKYGDAQDKYDRMEELIDPSEHKGLSTDEADYKQSREMTEELDGFVLELESTGIDIRKFRYRGRVYGADHISSLFYEKLWDVPLMERMGRIAEFVIDEEETLRGKDLSSEEKQYIRDSLDSMYVTRDIIGLYNMFLESTGREPLKAYITGTEEEVLTAEPDDANEEAEEQPVYVRKDKGFLRVDTIPYEDVYPILYLKYSLFDEEYGRPVKHLIIDEMQDYSYLQYRLIDKVFKCAMTILGDKDQTLDSKSRDVLEFLPSVFGRDMYSVELDKSYRSTIEITEYAAGIIGLDRVSSIDRHGEPVKETLSDSEEHRMRSLIEDIDAVKDSCETMAVLCKNSTRAKEVFDHLNKLNPDSELSLLTVDSTSFKKGISVAPFYLSKGLEFDAVFVVDDRFEPEELYRQALYVEATRALHRLFVYKQ
ncbi:MAG: AAA family ATPase [Lachnospiraceae bacterium]|nr:AAA family ATPase [Lachnospiraceae bacterium]